MNENEEGAAKLDVYTLLGVPPKFIPFLMAEEHIKLECWDTARDFQAIDDWISGDKNREDFVYCHMEMTSNFNWHYPLYKHSQTWDRDQDPGLAGSQE